MAPVTRQLDGEQTINVRMEVDRIEIIEDGPQGIAQVWGHVGDYEVCVYLRRGDPRVRKLMNDDLQRGHQ